MIKRNKVLLVSLNNIYATPYLQTYIFKDVSNEYTLFYWNRDNIEEKYEGVELLPLKITENKLKNKFINKFQTIIKYWKFKRRLKQHLKKYNYNKIVFLNNVPAVLMYRFIIKNYSNNYIIDIRDYTLESNYFFYEIQKRLINNSYITVLSSSAYKNFLPVFDKYFISHNYTNIKKINFNNGENNNKIIISNIGYIRFMEENKKLIRDFANNKDFEIRFIGKGSNLLKDFCEKNNIKNVVLKDRFDPKDTLKHFLEADIINNVYGNNNKYLDFALSNKLYYAAQIKKPILVSENTYMEKVTKKYNFGITYKDNEENVANYVLNQYKKIDKTLLQRGADDFLEIVKKENNLTAEKIKMFFKI